MDQLKCKRGEETLSTFSSPCLMAWCGEKSTTEYTTTNKALKLLRSKALLSGPVGFSAKLRNTNRGVWRVCSETNAAILCNGKSFPSFEAGLALPSRRVNIARIHPVFK
ncbi:hypothetical protein KP509_26G071400 [Ceratopteris richardii]|uniref:Uncharacterized protein n=1 Tax=Ceratopteris richardii TaxID=49495 RepID=A0A8T2RM81_CERRI|nr:hypothetical protein KP509_26G071400 [Ceratopteris richardii]